MKIKFFLISAMVTMPIVLAAVTCYDQNISIRVGQKFSKTLTTNPSTGYMWNVSVKPLGVVKVDSKIFPDNSRPGFTGVPAKEVFTYSGIKKGRVRVVLTYRRPWEKGIASIKKIVYNITVK